MYYKKNFAPLKIVKKNVKLSKRKEKNNLNSLKFLLFL